MVPILLARLLKAAKLNSDVQMLGNWCSRDAFSMARIELLNTSIKPLSPLDHGYKPLTQARNHLQGRRNKITGILQS